MNTIHEYNPFIEPHKSDPFSFYDWSLREAPVVFSSLLGAYLVSRYDDILAVVQDPHRFSAKVAVPDLFDNPPEVVEILRAGGVPENTPMLIQADPPRHTRLRRIVTRALSPQRVAALRPTIQRIAHELIDAFAERGRAELLQEFVNPLTRLVVCELLGVPRADVERIDAWVDHMLAVMYPTTPLDQKIASARAFVEWVEYIRALVQARRAAPRDDLVSALLTAHGDDLEPLTDDELVHLFREQRVAGTDTARGAIALSLSNLFEDRGRWETICRDPSTIPDFVEETLRHDGPSRGTMRVALEDIELSGVKIPAGSRLLLLFGAAGRDPAQFPSPERFDPQRENRAEHLAFGRGTHYCAGVQLGRLDVRVALESLSGRLPGLRPVAGFVPRCLPSHIFVNYERFDVEW